MATAVAIESSPPDGRDAYGIGETISVGVSFNQPVTVDETAGSPSLALTIGDRERQAIYSNGSNTRHLVFRYRVTDGDADAEDVAIPDDVVRKRIELALGKAEGEPITVAEMATLTSLDLSRVVVTDLTGLEYAVNLRELFLGGNAIADLSPLDGLAVAVRHTTAPGVGNLTYGGDEPWQPIATLRAPRTPLNMGYARAFMAGGYLNLIWARDDIDAGIDVWDVSVPRDPVLHRTWNDDRLREAHGLGLWNRDGRIVLAAQSQEGVAFYDVTDVGERLPLLAELDLPGVGSADYGGAWWLSVQAPHVYVATIGGGLHVVDATDPAAPRQVNHLPTGALGGFSPGNVYALGNLLVLAAVDEARGFATMDISDPVNPVLLETTNGAAGYSHLFTAGLLLSSGNRLNANRMYVHRVDHDGGIRYVGEAGENLGEGGYGSYQDGYFLSGFSKQVAKFTIDPPAQVGAGTSGIDLRDEDWAQPLGNLILASDDKNVGTALIPHQAAPDTTGPEVVWRHPAASAAGLALTTRIGVSLSDVVAVESLTPANFRVRVPGRGVVAGQLSVNQNNVNFSPDAPLAPSTTYAVEVCNLADLVGNAGGCAGWTFTTRAEETADRAPTCSLARLAPVEAGVETTYVPASTAHAPAAHTWDFGAGEPVGPQVTPAAAFTYPAPGRFPVILRVSNAHGASQCSAVQIVHAPVTDVAPVSSSSIVTTVTRVDVNPHPDFWTSRNLTDVYVANPDNDTVTRLFWDNTKVWETKVGDNPRTLAAQPDDDLWAPDRIWVANQGSGDISVLNRDGDLVRTIDLGYGAAPYGIVFAPDGGAAYVTLEGSGRLLKLDPETGRTVAALDLGAGPRGIAVSGDSRRIFVTRFVSAFAESDAAGEDDAAGEVYEVDAATFTVTRTIELAFDPGPDTESSGRGVPNYLSQVRIAPGGGTAWIPSKKDNLARGRYRDDNDLDFETQTRAIVSQIDLTANAEALDRRIDFDDRGLAQALAFTPAGDAVVVAFQGSNVIEVWDAAARTRLSEIPVGRAPAGLVFSPDGRRLYVHNFLDRSVTVLNTAGLLDGTVNEPIVVATVSTVAEEALAPEVLRGKRIFYNAADARMSLDGYLSCASCHLDGGADGMVWDRTQFGEGLRNTIDLRGRRGANGGFVHWTANFDEIQDFEHDIRDAFGGTGFMTDSDFRTGTRDDPLGDPKADISAELDALAAYVTSLSETPDSPYRTDDGSLTAAAWAGRAVFRDGGCARCHAGADFTDDLLHDVGTIAPASGQGSGAPLTGINTPTLMGLWLSAPYLHDGSAATLGEVLDNPTHMGGALTGEEKSALEAYLLQIDGPVGTLRGRRLLVGDSAMTEVGGAFQDPEGDTITYAVSSSDTSVARVTLSGTRVTIIPVAEGRTTITVTATGEGSNQSRTQQFTVRVLPTTTVDYDTDDDGLIEISNLAQLDAVRHDLNGSGRNFDAGHAEAFPDGGDVLACGGLLGCVGYELNADLNFDTDRSGEADAGDAYWNDGAGWVPIGDSSGSVSGFAAIFEGNGRTITHLFIDSRENDIGLFGATRSAAVIRDLEMVSVLVTGTDNVGGLAGSNGGAVSGCYATGKVSGDDDVGGLVGANLDDGSVSASYSTVQVTGDDRIGGLAGSNSGEVTAAYATGRVVGDTEAGGLLGRNTGDVNVSYATGRVSGRRTIGGLIGWNSGDVKASYLTGLVSGGSKIGGLVGDNTGGGTITDSYWDTDTSGWTTGSGGQGQTTAELQLPTAASGIYQTWNLDGDGMNDDPWDFGTSSQYPALKANFDGQGTATWQEFGQQIRAGPALMATPTVGQVTLTWSVISGGAYNLYRTSGTTVEILSENTSSHTYVDTDVTAGATYVYQVAAVINGGEASRSPRVSVVGPMIGTPDDSPALLVTPEALTVVEAGSDTYAVELRTRPTADVTVTITGASGDLSLDKTSLVFTGTDWRDPREVTVTAADDADSARDPDVTLTHRGSGAAEYRGLSADLVVSIRENDPGLVFSESSLTVTEGESATYTVALATEPSGTVTVAVSGVSGDLSLDKTEPYFGVGDWDDAQTITVEAAEDDDTSTDPSVTLTHEATGGGYDGIVGSVRVSVTENDGGGTGGGSGGGGANHPPVIEREIPAQTLDVGEVLELDIRLNFYDRDQRALDYTAESADRSVATVAVDRNGVLTIRGIARGVTAITVTAADRRDERVSQAFAVTVRGPFLVGLFPRASDAVREGFVRVINRSLEAGEVTIEATDDAGTRLGPVTLSVGAGATAHFNSNDLEQGNASKGLPSGVGSAEGDWRLELTSALEIEVLSYIRTADGFLTSMHDSAPVAGGVHRVAIFNPGSNPNQVSRLRLLNLGSEEALVRITGIDDAGASPGESVLVAVPAGAARTVTAVALETGTGGVEDALGDGAGKWRLRVDSDQPIRVMSLLSSPTGHLTNLSTAPDRGGP